MNKSKFKGLAELEAKELLNQIAQESFYRLNFYFMLAELHKKDLDLFFKLKKFIGDVEKTRLNIQDKIQKTS